jgi:hypothetical protein
MLYFQVVNKAPDTPAIAPPPALLAVLSRSSSESYEHRRYARMVRERPADLDVRLTALLELGFDRDKCEEAFLQARGDINRAASLLVDAGSRRGAMRPIHADFGFRRMRSAEAAVPRLFALFEHASVADGHNAGDERIGRPRRRVAVARRAARPRVHAVLDADELSDSDEGQPPGDANAGVGEAVGARGRRVDPNDEFPVEQIEEQGGVAEELIHMFS